MYSPVCGFVSLFVRLFVNKVAPKLMDEILMKFLGAGMFIPRGGIP